MFRGKILVAGKALTVSALLKGDSPSAGNRLSVIRWETATYAPPSIHISLPGESDVVDTRSLSCTSKTQSYCLGFSRYAEHIILSHALGATSSITERQRRICNRCFTTFSMTGWSSALQAGGNPFCVNWYIIPLFHVSFFVICRNNQEACSVS